MMRSCEGCGTRPRGSGTPAVTGRVPSGDRPDVAVSWTQALAAWSDGAPSPIRTAAASVRIAVNLVMRDPPTGRAPAGDPDDHGRSGPRRDLVDPRVEEH